jgi:hypothetical protein
VEVKRIISERPMCKSCGIPMKEWDPFAEEHEHIECISNRISNNLLEIIKESFKNSKIEYQTKND